MNSAYNTAYALSTPTDNAGLIGGHDNIQTVLPEQHSIQPYVPSTQRPTISGYYNPANEPAEVINVNKTSATDKHTAAYRSLFNIPNKQQEPSSLPNFSQDHASGCNGARGASTPPPSPPPQPSQTDSSNKHTITGKVWSGPDDLRDVSKAFLREKRWHDKVSVLHPSIPLASHRYWVGVLNHNVSPKNATREDQFIWMKGNRLTTVETVRKVWMATTMLENVVLLCNGENLEDGVRMEELDFHSDKVVMFKVAEEGSKEAVGRKLAEGLVTKEIEVIELDDD